MPKKVVIDRSKWLNAHTRYTLGPSLMLDHNGNMCCLGFVCAAEGVSEENLCNMVTPRYIRSAPIALTDASLVGSSKKYPQSTELTNNAMEYNDFPGITTAGREKALIQIFAAEGTYELEFVGEYPDEHASSNT